MRYSEEFKQQVVQRHESGEAIPTLSQELHIAPSTLYHWRTVYASIPTAEKVYTPSEINRLVKKLSHAEHKLEILHLTNLLLEIPLKTRLNALEQLYRLPENPYSVHELCEALQVDRGTFYNHIFRRVDPSKRMQEHEALCQKIQEIFDDSGQRFGKAKIHAVLSQQGLQVSERRISAIMNQLGLKSIRDTSKKQYNNIQRKERKNRLERNFVAAHPNQIWVSDVTQFRVNDYNLYLCVIIDLYSRMVVGYRVSRNASTHLVSLTFKNAYLSRGTPSGLTFHSDQGTQYASGKFTSQLKSCGVTQSFSKPGTPLDNAVAETFFATFKKEEAYRRIYTSEKSFRDSVDRYMIFYNQQRPHETLKYKTPMAFEEQIE